MDVISITSLDDADCPLLLFFATLHLLFEFSMFCQCDKYPTDVLFIYIYVWTVKIEFMTKDIQVCIRIPIAVTQEDSNLEFFCILRDPHFARLRLPYFK